MTPVDGLGVGNFPPAFAEDVEFEPGQPENFRPVDSLESRDGPSQNPIAELAGCISSCLIVTVVILVVLPVYFLYKACQSCVEYLRDSFDEFKRWLYPEETIPEEFHNDPILSENLCPIACAPIRFPVSDSRHPNHIYEKSAILRWLSRDGRSPNTREPMTPNDLIPCNELQARIEARLRELRAIEQ